MDKILSAKGMIMPPDCVVHGRALCPFDIQRFAYFIQHGKNKIKINFEFGMEIPDRLPIVANPGIDSGKPFVEARSET